MKLLPRGSAHPPWHVLVLSALFVLLLLINGVAALWQQLQAPTPTRPGPPRHSTPPRPRRYR